MHFVTPCKPSQTTRAKKVGVRALMKQIIRINFLLLLLNNNTRAAGTNVKINKGYIPM